MFPLVYLSAQVGYGQPNPAVSLFMPNPTPMKNFILTTLLISILSACAAAKPPGHTDAREVYKPEGSRQCEPGSGVGAAELRAELAAARIPVLGYRPGSDERVHPAVCGAQTGRIHVFTIPAAAVADAQALGYRPVGE